MFQSSAERLRTVLRWAEEVLADAPEQPQDNHDNFIDHPHRRPLRWQRERRPGAVPASPAYCVSPVRPVAGYGTPSWLDFEAADR
jgi:hypothetical protein